MKRFIVNLFFTESEKRVIWNSILYSDFRYRKRGKNGLGGFIMKWRKAFGGETSLEEKKSK